MYISLYMCVYIYIYIHVGVPPPFCCLGAEAEPSCGSINIIMLYVYMYNM